MKKNLLLVLRPLTLLMLISSVVYYLFSIINAYVSYKYELDTFLFEKNHYYEIALQHIEREIFLSKLGFTVSFVLLVLFIIEQKFRKNE